MVSLPQVVVRFRSLRALGWRNLAPLQLVFDPTARLNVLSGDNGQGKTNVIEALYYLAAFRSFRTSRALDLVQRGSAVAQIGVEAETTAIIRAIDVQLTVRAPALADASEAQGDHTPVSAKVVVAAAGVGAAPTALVGRTIKRDGKPVRGVAAAFGALSVVLFVPEDLLLIRAPPAARRRFIDMAISAVEPAYFAEAAAFQRILRSRNAVLRSAPTSGLPTLLDTYDEQLAQAGARVIARRRVLVEALGPAVTRIFRSLHADMPVGLYYRSHQTVPEGATEPEVVLALRAGLSKRRALDLRRGHSTYGPHTDDLEVILAQRPAREHASQGQLRSLVLAMKLAELEHVELQRGEAPVLLLDDVPSELDPTRRHYLFQTLAGLSCQTIVSVADPDVVPPFSGRSDFVVRGGCVAAAPVSPLQSVT